MQVEVWSGRLIVAFCVFMPLGLIVCGFAVFFLFSLSGMRTVVLDNGDLLAHSECDHVARNRTSGDRREKQPYSVTYKGPSRFCRGIFLFTVQYPSCVSESHTPATKDFAVTAGRALMLPTCAEPGSEYSYAYFRIELLWASDRDAGVRFCVLSRFAAQVNYGV